MLGTVFLHCSVDGEALAKLALWLKIALWLCVPSCAEPYCWPLQCSAAACAAASAGRAVPAAFLQTTRGCPLKLGCPSVASCSAMALAGVPSLQFGE